MMGKYLLAVNEAFRVSSLNDVEALQEEFKSDGRYTLASFTWTEKYDKKADMEYYVVKAKKVFNTEKELINKYDIEYVEGQKGFEI